MAGVIAVIAAAWAGSGTCELPAEIPAPQAGSEASGYHLVPVDLNRLFVAVRDDFRARRDALPPLDDPDRVREVQNRFDDALVDRAYADLRAGLLAAPVGGEIVVQFLYAAEPRSVADVLASTGDVLPSERLDPKGALKSDGARAIELAILKAKHDHVDGLDRVTFVVLAACNSEANASTIEAALAINPVIRGVYTSTDDIGLAVGEIGWGIGDASHRPMPAVVRYTPTGNPEDVVRTAPYGEFAGEVRGARRTEVERNLGAFFSSGTWPIVASLPAPSGGGGVPASRDVRLGLTLGWGGGYGEYEKGVAIADQTNGAVPIELAGLVAVTDRLAAGAFGTFGPVMPACGSGKGEDCKASRLRLGVGGELTLVETRSVASAVRLDVGRELVEGHTDIRKVRPYDYDVGGWDATGGVRVTVPVHQGLALGPTVTGTVGRYDHAAITLDGTRTPRKIENQVMHGWYQLGISMTWSP
jgi:hypothetical protein